MSCFISFIINIFCRNNLSRSFFARIFVCRWIAIVKKGPRATTARSISWKIANSTAQVWQWLFTFRTQGVSPRLKLEADRYSHFLRDFLRPLNLQVGVDVCLRRFLSFAFLASPLTGHAYVLFRHWSFLPSPWLFPSLFLFFPQSFFHVIKFTLRRPCESLRS